MTNIEKDEIKKKILTATIGSLARFEKFFGHLWGHGKEHISANEEQMLDLWEEARYEILNLGNQQIRAIDKIFSNYSYNIKFKIKDNNNEN
jgi:hypothetical protein